MARRIPLIVACTLLPALASADEFDKLVRYSCDTKADLVRIEYAGAFPYINKQAGKALQASKGKNAWDPWDLVSLDETGNFVKSIREIKRTCSLSDGRYLVTIAPVPGNANIQGNCGGWVTASAQIRRPGNEIVSIQFEKSCNDFESPVITEVLIRPGAGPPEQVEVSPKQFYQ